MTTTNEQQLELYEQYRKEQEYTKGLKDALVKLVQTPEYQVVFENYLFDVKLKQYVNELATTTAEPLVRKVQAQIASIAYVQNMLKDIILSGSSAEANLQLTEEDFINYLNGDE